MASKFLSMGSFMPRDEASDAAAAMAAYQAGIDYAIKFIVLYLVECLAVVVCVGSMALCASPRVRKSPVFVIISTVTLLCIVACGINVSQNHDLVVTPSEGIDRARYTTIIAIGFFIPFLADFTLLFRILAFYPPRSCSWWKPLVAVAFPALVKVPRFIIIIMYVHYCWRATDNAGSMAIVVNRVNQTQLAVCDWGMMLADQLYCTLFLMNKLYRLGWGWGDEKFVSRSFISTLRAVLYSALASFAIPTFFLIALIIMQVLKYRPDLEGYVFTTFFHVSIAGTAFACLWPAIRADRRQNKKNLALHSSGLTGTCYKCGEEGGARSHNISGTAFVSQSHFDGRQIISTVEMVNDSADSLPPFSSLREKPAGARTNPFDQDGTQPPVVLYDESRDTKSSPSSPGLSRGSTEEVSSHEQAANRKLNQQNTTQARQGRGVGDASSGSEEVMGSSHMPLTPASGEGNLALGSRFESARNFTPSSHPYSIQMMEIQREAEAAAIQSRSQRSVMPSSDRDLEIASQVAGRTRGHRACSISNVNQLTPIHSVPEHDVDAFAGSMSQSCPSPRVPIQSAANRSNILYEGKGPKPVDFSGIRIETTEETWTD
ncbi:hypothetical protein IE53DRAFT_88751 [Violaceomyces palustris]|uniref:Uncharacterized protein n=1 Tax=Violaceomyces palustris TaxID=1673888 RepID=A0ACD0NXV9_9BASI|nr:hypothetical protein IE53DRAFT_88751 [Violaceomyces palustris]